MWENQFCQPIFERNETYGQALDHFLAEYAICRAPFFSFHSFFFFRAYL